MGLFGKGKKEVQEPPDGWLTTDALVGEVDMDMVHLRGGAQGRKHKFSYTLVFHDEQRQLHSVAQEGWFNPALRAEDRGHAPLQGGRCTIAYDPADPTAVETLEDSHERSWRLARQGKAMANGGECAPATVTESVATRRIARPPHGTEGHEKELTLSVEADGGAFEVKKRFWDRQMDIAAGTTGWYFYDGADRENGIPTFADQEDKLQPDPLGAAREKWIAKLRDIEIPKGY